MTHACIANGSVQALEGWWDTPTPRTALAFLDLERLVLKAAGQVVDAILEYHVVQAHHDPVFVEQAVAAARSGHAGRLRHTGDRPTW